LAAARLQFRAWSVVRHRVETPTAARPAINDTFMQKEIEDS
jgi:hypothetical protein